MLAAVESFFDLHARKTTVARERRGGLSTFLTMAYILFANPAILRATGVPFEVGPYCFKKQRSTTALLHAAPRCLNGRRGAPALEVCISVWGGPSGPPLGGAKAPPYMPRVQNLNPNAASNVRPPVRPERHVG